MTVKNKADYTDGYPNEKQFNVPIADRIKYKLDHLQQCMEGQAHIDRPEYTSDVIDSITKYWSVLKEDDREYVESAKYALVEKLPWNINQ